jgi:hypothetical protein
MLNGFPPDFRRTVTAGSATLREVGGEVRGIATKRPDAPQLWLVVRDLEGLAGRLAIIDESEEGFLNLVTGQDLGVLDELIANRVPLGGIPLVSLRREREVTLFQLRDALGRWLRA